MKALDRLLYSIMIPVLNRQAGFRTGKIYYQLRESERWPRAQLDELQKGKLLDLLHSATQHVPYYRTPTYSTVPHEEPARTILAKLPVLAKASVRQAGMSIRNPRYWRVQKSRTGGTTGEPLEIWRSNASVSVGEAAFWRGKAWVGIRPWDKAVVIQGFSKGSWHGRLRMRLVRKWSVEAFQPGSTDRERTLGLIRRIRPAVVEGFVTDLLSLSEGRDLVATGVRAVLTTGEMLYPDQKAALSKAFGAPVFSYYGCNEINSLAFECEYGHRHVTDEHVILEAVDDLGQPVWEQPGRLLVTDLDNHAMPLIRYELGDLGVLTQETCACGRHLQILKDLLGRQQDALCNAAGDRLSATFFAGRFRGLRHVARLQLVQHDLQNVEILYESLDQDAAQELNEIADEIRTRLGRVMQVRASRVEKIPLTASGKRLLIRQLAKQTTTGERRA